MSENEIEVTFDELGLREEVLRGIKDAGYTSPTPIQAQIIPEALKGRDVLGSAETGSGKTAAFMIPALHNLTGGKPGVRCLVLEPTRELAIQVNTVAVELGKHTGLSSVVVFGGAPLGQQVAKIKAGADVIVATPGRLIDMAWSGHVDFNMVTHLVVDEVDRMFDMGFVDDVNQIISFLPRAGVQKLFFSATMPAEVQKMINNHLSDPAVVTIGRRSKPAEGITHELYIAEGRNKYKVLKHLLGSKDMESAIIFSETKHGADKLYKQLCDDRFNVAPFHSGFDQVKRYDILRRFRNGKVKTLVATNVAARGLDITGISHIFNYDVPPTTEDYVHRIGRSARAKATGVAITIASPQEEKYVRRIEKMIEMNLPVQVIENMTMEGFPEFKKNPGGKGGGGGKPGGGRGGGPKPHGGQSQSRGGGKPGGGKNFRPRNKPSGGGQ